jgi:hypothetical protein
VVTDLSTTANEFNNPSRAGVPVEYTAKAMPRLGGENASLLASRSEKGIHWVEIEHSPAHGATFLAGEAPNLQEDTCERLRAFSSLARRREMRPSRF